MAPTKSKYTQVLERNGRTVTVERALDGKDFLKLWMLDNGQEVLERERLDREEGRFEGK
jgi:large subunit ribosomal protein L41